MNALHSTPRRSTSNLFNTGGCDGRCGSQQENVSDAACLSLQKEGHQISFLLTDMESGGFELKLMRSDAVTWSIQSFRDREDAMAEAKRQVRNDVAHGWAIDSDRS